MSRTRAPNLTVLARLLSTAVAAIALAAAAPPARAEVDGDAALALLKANKCTSCHSPTKTKKGPAYKKVAEKYKGDPNAEQKLLKHMTSSPVVKLSDGSEEEHDMIEADDPKAIRNVIQWILTR
jgi:cytochrome c